MNDNELVALGPVIAPLVEAAAWDAAYKGAIDAVATGGESLFYDNGPLDFVPGSGVVRGFDSTKKILEGSAVGDPVSLSEATVSALTGSQIADRIHRGQRASESMARLGSTTMEDYLAAKEREDIAIANGERLANEMQRRLLSDQVEEKQEMIDAMKAKIDATKEKGSSNFSSGAFNISNVMKRGLDIGGEALLGKKFFKGVRSSRADGKRVSKEPHEYRYCKEIVKSLVIPGGPHANGMSYIDSALQFILRGWERGAIANSRGWMTTSATTALLGFDPGPSNLNFLQEGYSFGNFADSPHMRKLIAKIRKIVRLVRSANVKEILELKDGSTPSNFITVIMDSLSTADYILAVCEHIIIDNDLDQTAITPEQIANTLEPTDSDVVYQF